MLKDWFPPIIWRILGKAKRSTITYHGDFPSWQDAVSASSGYDKENILNKVKSATLKVKNGEAVYERDSVLFNKTHYSWPTLSGLMWAASQENGSLRVLDFGGSLGSSYFQNLKFLQKVPDVEWGVVEQPHFVECGKQYVEDDQLKFYETIDECISEIKPNVILVSSVLQYIEMPYDILRVLMKIKARCMIIDRTPFSKKGDDKLVVQHVPESIYSASYPSWIFSRSCFMKNISQSWDLIADIDWSEGKWYRTQSGFDFNYSGFILGNNTVL